MRMSSDNFGDASYSDKDGSDSDKDKAIKTRVIKDRSVGQRYISNACKNCRSLHRRCNGQPNCSNCKRRGIACVYGEPTKRGPKSRKVSVADNDNNNQDQNLKRPTKLKRGSSNDNLEYSTVHLYNNKNPFAESKQDSAAELSEPFEVSEARILSYYSDPTLYPMYDNSPDKPLLDAAWYDLQQTWGMVVPLMAIRLPNRVPSISSGNNDHNNTTPHHSLPTSTLHLLTAQNLQHLLPFYQSQLLAAHAYRGVLIAFGFLIQNQRNQANQMMDATHMIINYLCSSQTHPSNNNERDLTMLLASSQIFGALFYVNVGKSDLAARLTEGAYYTCVSFQGDPHFPLNIWHKLYVVSAALAPENTQPTWESYSAVILEDKKNLNERPYQLLAHIILIFLSTSNVFKDVAHFNLPPNSESLNARIEQLRFLEDLVHNVSQNNNYHRQYCLSMFFLRSIMALMYLQSIKLHELHIDQGYHHVQECLKEARMQLTRLPPIKCCPALSLAIWLNTAIVKKMHELGKEVPQTVEAWNLLHTFVSPTVEEREKYPDNYGAGLHKLFTTHSSSTDTSRRVPVLKAAEGGYHAQYYPQTPLYPSIPGQPSTPGNILPPRSVAGYTDQSYHSATWSPSQQSKPVEQYVQYPRPNYTTAPKNGNPHLTQQYTSPSSSNASNIGGAHSIHHSLPSSFLNQHSH